MKRWFISEKTVAAANRLSAAYERPLRRSYLALIAAMGILPFVFLFLGLHPFIAPLLSAAVFAVTTIVIAKKRSPQHALELTHEEFTGLRRVWLAPLLIQISIAGVALQIGSTLARREVALIVGLINVWSFTVAIAFAYALNERLKTKS